MYTFIVIFHVLACLALILIVLLQTGRGAEMGAAFGGASQTLFGGSGGTTFLSKLTTGAAIVFMLTCLSLTYLSVGPSGGKSVMEDVPASQPQGPVVPEAKPVQPLPEPAKVPEAATKPQESAALPEPAKPVSSEPSVSSQPSQASQAGNVAAEQKKAEPSQSQPADAKAQGKKQDKAPARKQ